MPGEVSQGGKAFPIGGGVILWEKGFLGKGGICVGKGS